MAFILLSINLIFAPHNPYQEKDSAFECGFHSFLGQNRTQFSISFFIFALLFLLFDLEILLVYPYSVSAYNNDIYGLITMLIFFLVLTLGFAFELGKNALKIETRQIISVVKKILKAILKKSGLKLFYLLLNIVCYLILFSIYFILAATITVLIIEGFFRKTLYKKTKKTGEYANFGTALEWTRAVLPEDKLEFFFKSILSLLKKLKIRITQLVKK